MLNGKYLPQITGSMIYVSKIELEDYDLMLRHNRDLSSMLKRVIEEALKDFIEVAKLDQETQSLRAMPYW
jgi:hypothetical protein